ncbi:WXG100 family type VII secretion target [Tumebacillus flagellatus]|uniref:LXG domain-containing protein n=1 Tax=Tumebacillus flagellatus TaxID=1157490 RepID=A0A074LQV9_9BACL|nr:WXG100 family type VII secretion target [Tumebacillus flagellatus]KEO84511.1 hypothetical protein EL26_03040 [Tumebacillus flagellatus]
MLQLDPYNLRYAANRFSAGADDLRGRAGRFLAESQNLQSSWRGSASAVYQKVCELLHGDFLKAAGALERISSEFGTLATSYDSILELRRQASQMESQLMYLDESRQENQSEAHYLRQRAHDLRYAAEMEALAADQRAAGAFREIQTISDHLVFHALQDKINGYSKVPAPASSTWKEKSKHFLEFLGGAAYALGNNATFGFLQKLFDDEADLRSTEYLQGKVLGDEVAVGLGVVGAIGALMEAVVEEGGGVLLSSTGVGIPEGAALAVVGALSAAEALYGAGVAVSGYLNLENDQMLLATKNPEYQELKKRAGTASSNAEKGQIAEELADVVLKKAGYEKLPSKVGSNNGFDGVYVKYGKDGDIEDILIDIIVNESKFGTSRLGKTVDGAKQMSREWIEKNITKMMRSDDPDVRKAGKLLKDNFDMIRTKLNRLKSTGFNKWFSDPGGFGQ